MHIFQRLNGSSIPLSGTQGNSSLIKNIQNEIRRFLVLQIFPHATRPDAGECINDVVFDLYGTKLVPQTGVTPPPLTWMAQWLMPLRMETPVKVGSMYEQLHFDLWCSRGYELMAGFHCHLFVEMYVTSLFFKATETKDPVKSWISWKNFGCCHTQSDFGKKEHDICLYPLSICVFETLSRYTRQLAAISSYRWCRHLKRVSLASLDV